MTCNSKDIIWMGRRSFRELIVDFIIIQRITPRINMKDLLTSFDVRALAGELQALCGAFIDNIYNDGEEFIVRTQKPNAMIYAKLGKPMWLCLAARKREFGTPSSFAMQLRKHIRSFRIRHVRQHKFERIVEFTLEQHENQYKLVFELFSHGNVLLLKEGKIIGAFRSEEWKDRSVKPGVPYIYPPARADPYEADMDKIKSLVAAAPQTPISKILAVELNLGREYAERVCEAANVGILVPAGMLNEQDAERIFGALKSLLEVVEKNPAPVILYKDGTPIDFAPLAPKAQPEIEPKAAANAPKAGPPIAGEIETRNVRTISEAIDKYFSSASAAGAESVFQKKLDAERERIKRQMDMLRNHLHEMEADVEKFKRFGNLIYSNMEEATWLIATLSEIREKEGWQGIEKRIREKSEQFAAVLGINPDECAVEAMLGGEKVDLDFRRSAVNNANRYYEKSKKLKDKTGGAKVALEETMRKMSELENRIRAEQQAKAAPALPAKQKEFWFEKYRWFFTSGWHLAIGGRDAKSNEEVVKKHLGDKDRYAHADIHGAPSVVIKSGQKTSGQCSVTGDQSVLTADHSPLITEFAEQELSEACAFTACYSRAWNAGAAAAEAYWVMPEQVSKTPSAGEYLAKGAFVIRGEKHFFHRIPLRVAIGEMRFGAAGTPDKEGEFRKMTGAPEEALSKYADHYFIVEPWGDEKERSATAKKISEELKFGIDEVMKVLPGNCRIVGKVGAIG